MTRFGLPAIVLAALLTTGCDDQAAPKAPPSSGPPEVTVAAPLQKTITEWDEYTGRFEAVESVDLRARVSGYLNAIHFRDGQIVEKGARLFVIDPRRFEIAVQLAKASVDQARAQLTLARSRSPSAAISRRASWKPAKPPSPRRSPVCRGRRQRCGRRSLSWNGPTSAPRFRGGSRTHASMSAISSRAARAAMQRC